MSVIMGELSVRVGHMNVGGYYGLGEMNKQV